MIFIGFKPWFNSFSVFNIQTWKLIIILNTWVVHISLRTFLIDVVKATSSHCWVLLGTTLKWSILVEVVSCSCRSLSIGTLWSSIVIIRHINKNWMILNSWVILLLIYMIDHFFIHMNWIFHSMLLLTHLLNLALIKLLFWSNHLKNFTKSLPISSNSFIWFSERKLFPS